MQWAELFWKGNTRQTARSGLTGYSSKLFIP